MASDRSLLNKGLSDGKLLESEPGLTRMAGKRAPELPTHYTNDICFATYGFLATGMQHDSGACFQGPISRIQRLVSMDVGIGGSPSNIWPKDRSWFVFAHWDLWGTKVGVTRESIDQIIDDEDLETLVWPDTSEQLADD